ASFDENAAKQLAENLNGTRLFILGEMHGVKENADVIYTLFKKFGFRQLALEWEPGLRAVAEKFIESGELDFDAVKDSPDGRITAGHFALLKKLKSEGMLNRLVCFDGGSGGEGWNARDAAMARNIVANLSDTPTLVVVVGNLHAKTEPFTFDDESEEQHPMGENVKKEIPGVASGRIEYITGQYHNYGIREFGKLSKGEESPEARFYQDEDGLYVFEVPEAHAATVPNPHEKI
ncbi:MAG: hypothetical protein U1A16_03525, partial [Patescibacteria group bacterium]|nr:hypothetical protein [Patescibacteria group bacterium]